MKISLPSSDRDRLWTLTERVSHDIFDWEKEGSAALLLIAMHMTDLRPWTCARNPVFMLREPGLIDRETKRILGKRFRSEMSETDRPFSPLDPLWLVLKKLEPFHRFETPVTHWPEWEKKPGFLPPRKLLASAEIRVADQVLTLHSRNFSEISQVLHAELTLLFALASRLASPRIDSFRLHATLKPCKMCAAFLHAIKPHCKEFSVTFEEPDPGPLAANTLLDQFGYFPKLQDF